MVLLHIQCGKPPYVAPEVLRREGYNGAGGVEMGRVRRRRSFLFRFLSLKFKLFAVFFMSFFKHPHEIEQSRHNCSSNNIILESTNENEPSLYLLSYLNRKPVPRSDLCSKDTCTLSDFGPAARRLDFPAAFGTTAEKRLSSSDMSNSGALARKRKQVIGVNQEQNEGMKRRKKEIKKYSHQYLEASSGL
nr:hypothetical protein Iba_chr01cCG2590 [Ipomoea batatas]